MEKFSLVLIFAFFNCYSQISFSTKVLLDRTHYPVNIASTASADLNNDGFKELIVASYYDNSLIFYKNINGDLQKNIRSFVYQIPNYSSYSFNHVKCADLDGDGLTDIIVTSSAEDKVYWFKNLGNFIFGSLQVIAQNIDYPTSVAIADIDHDGDQDVVIAAYNDRKVFLTKSNSGGSFGTPSVILSASNGINAVRLFDIDNNGFLDVITGEDGGGMRMVKNINGSDFHPPQLITYAASPGLGFDFLDLNGDGFAELVFFASQNPSLRYLINQAGLGFSSSGIAIGNVISPYQLMVTDFDGDINKDIVFSTHEGYNSKIGWFKNLSGTFSPSQILVANVNNPLSFVPEDFDNDNHKEIASASYDASSSISTHRKLSVFKKNAANNYDEKVITFNYGSLATLRRIDIDNDGNKDILSAFHNGLTYILNTGTSEFSSYKTIGSIQDILNYSYDIEVADFDADGLEDIIWVTKNNGIQIFKNNGNEVFSLAYTYAFPSVMASINIEVGDINNDNKLDFFLSYEEGGQKKLFKTIQTNNFGFQLPQQINFSNIDKIRALDIDNNGTLDVVGTQNANFIRLNNDGAANFTLQIISTLPAYANTILAVGDIDNDGDVDLVCGENYAYDNRKLYFIKNNLTSFSSPVLIDNISCTDIQIGDINNDGYKDIVGASYKAFAPYDEKVFYYLNNAGSSFSTRSDIESLGDAMHPYKPLLITDINNDTKMDIVSGYAGQNTLKLFINNSSNLHTSENFINDDKNIVLFPNPFTNEINWKSTLKIVEAYIYDYSGRLVSNKKKISGNKILIEGLPAGNYVLQLISNEGKSKTFAIIKN